MNVLSEEKKMDDSDVAGKNAMVENELLKIENTNLKTQLDAVKKALVKAQDTIEHQERAKMIPVILANTSMTKEEVYAMDTDSMFSLTETFRILKKPPTPVAGVKPSADEDESTSRLRVPNKFRYGGKQ